MTTWPNTFVLFFSPLFFSSIIIIFFCFVLNWAELNQAPGFKLSADNIQTRAGKKETGQKERETVLGREKKSIHKQGANKQTDIKMQKEVIGIPAP